MISRRNSMLAAAALVAAPAIRQARAQGSAWPNRPIRLVVPYPPGGASDISGRLQAEVLQQALGQPVVVDNRSGAGGTIGTAFVAQSPPDGYTIMMASPSSHLGAPLLFRTPGYEGTDDFTAIATFATGTAVVCVHPSLPIRNIQELIAYAKANPGKLNYGSAGAGGANHMLGVLFMLRTGTELTHVPYRGAAPALADLIGGNIQIVFDSFSGVIGAIRAGQVRALGVTVPIVAGIMPIHNYARIAQFAARDGIEIPRWVALKMEGYMDDAASIRAFGIEVVTRLCERLVAGGAPGIHCDSAGDSAGSATCPGMSAPRPSAPAADAAL